MNVVGSELISCDSFTTITGGLSETDAINTVLFLIKNLDRKIFKTAPTMCYMIKNHWMS